MANEAQKYTVQAFNNVVQGRDLQKALEFARDNPFSVVFEAAQQGNLDAINFIFYSSRKQIAAAFWKFFLGGAKIKPKIAQQRIEAGEADIFAAEVFAMLADIHGEANPLLTWDISKYDHLPEQEQLNKLGYYIYRYCQNLAYKLLRAHPEEYGYLSGRGGSEGLDTSYDALSDEGVDFADTKEDFANDYEVKSLKDQYLILLQTKYPKLYPVIKLRSEGFDTQTIAKKLGISPWNTNNLTAKAKEIFRDFANK